MAEYDQNDGYDSDTESTCSVVSSLYCTYTYMGREYSEFCPEYFLPVDVPEFCRLYDQHLLLLTAQKKLYQAPISQPTRVLDIGAGTGQWAIDLGDKYPSAVVKGTDKLPFQPSWVPPNVEFIANEDLVYLDEDRKNHYDLVHVQDMNGFISNPRKLSKDIYAITALGGYVERVEFDRWTVLDDDRYPSLKLFYQLLTQALKRRGCRLESEEDLVHSLKEAGFQKIQTTTFELSIEDCSPAYLYDTFLAYASQLLTKDHNWSKEKLMKFMKDVQKELKKVEFKLNLYSVHGQKPEHKS